jgi:hypothetical protein
MSPEVVSILLGLGAGAVASLIGALFHRGVWRKLDQVDLLGESVGALRIEIAVIRAKLEDGISDELNKIDGLVADNVRAQARFAEHDKWEREREERMFRDAKQAFLDVQKKRP